MQPRSVEEFAANLAPLPPVRVTVQEPSVQEMDQLRDGEYIALTDGTICVRCSHVDAHCLYYVCPSCWSRRKKSGLPYRHASRAVHIHGSGGDRRVRGHEHRVMHCTDTEASYKGQLVKHGVKSLYPNGVMLYVTPSTRGSVP